jgi:hypothetical protein
MRLLGIGNRLRVGLVTAVVVVIGLVSTSSGVAAPRDNILNARQCLKGGWHSLVMSNGSAFRGQVHCLLYALRGGTFGTVTPPPPVDDPPPPPPPPPSD